MLANIKISNVFGIRETYIDFERKNVIDKNFNDVDEQLIKSNNKFYALTPTFLGKNASGKTSLIKSIDVISNWLSRKSCLRTIQYAFFNFEKINDDSRNEQTNLKFAEYFTSNFFNSLAFKGSNDYKIDITTVKDDKASLFGDINDSIISINNKRLSISKLMSAAYKYIKSNPQNVLTFKEVSKVLETFVSEYIAKIDFSFIDFNSVAVYKNDIKLMDLLQYKAQINVRIKNIVSKFGVESFKMLLTRVDSNVSGFAFDNESGNVEINLKSSNVPISASNLSFGTQKIIELIEDSIMLFEEGGILLIDEIENGLHLSLIELLVEMFANSVINVGKAQLLLTTHNPLLAEREIIEPMNVYMDEEGQFLSVKQIFQKVNSIFKTYDVVKYTNSKSYYSDALWLDSNQSIKSTLSTVAKMKIIESFENSIMENRGA